MLKEVPDTSAAARKAEDLRPQRALLVAEQAPDFLALGHKLRLKLPVDPSIARNMHVSGAAIGHSGQGIGVGSRGGACQGEPHARIAYG